MRIGELSRRTGVSVHTLRAWERRYEVITPQRTRGGTRLYAPIDEARVRMMQRYLSEGASTAEAAELAAAASLTVGAGRAARVPAEHAARARRELRETLDRFAETGAMRVLESLFASYAPLLVIRDVLLPYMEGVGRRWERGEADVSQEHFATHFVETRLLSLTRGWDRGLGPRALLACAPGERHTIGLVACGLALHAHGWRITYLGADTSATALAFAARSVQPDVAIVSQTLAADPKLDGAALGCPLHLAGPGASPSRAAGIGAAHLAGDAVDAAWTLSAARVRPPTAPRPSA